MTIGGKGIRSSLVIVAESKKGAMPPTRDIRPSPAKVRGFAKAPGSVYEDGWNLQGRHRQRSLSGLHGYERIVQAPKKVQGAGLRNVLVPIRPAAQ